jgi:formylglycine-generating enzyme required for sulfatase activity
MLTALLATAIVSAQAEPMIQKLPESTVEFKMIPIEGGTVKIGETTVEVKPFHISQTEVPWEVFDQFLLSGEPTAKDDRTEYGPDAIARPSRSYILPDLGWGHKGYPVINVSYLSTDMFCRWLTSVTDKKYRVPTEAEWQLVAEAGDWKSELEESSWHYDNSDEVTNPVGKLKANKLGLYDLLGNVGEWTTDLKGKPVLCGPIFTDDMADMTPFQRRYWDPSWQETDPQLPKSRWWMSDGFFAGIRLVFEPKKG